MPRENLESIRQARERIDAEIQNLRYALPRELDEFRRNYEENIEKMEQDSREMKEAEDRLEEMEKDISDRSYTPPTLFG